MANKQIANLTQENSLNTSFVIPVQIANASQEAKKVSLSDVKTVFGISDPVDKVIKISLTSSEILSLFTSPKEIFPAVSGKLYVPRFAFFKFNYGTSTYFYPSGTFRFAYTIPSNYVVNISASGIITSNNDAQSMYNVTPSGPAYSGDPNTGGYFGKSLLLFLTNQDPISGDGTLDVYLTYSEITIS